MMWGGGVEVREEETARIELRKRIERGEVRGKIRVFNNESRENEGIKIENKMLCPNPANINLYIYNFIL